MVLPSWVTFLVAAFVITFGVFRIHLGRQLAATRRRGEDDADDARPNFRRRGYYARSPRTHYLFGVAYLGLGLICVAMGLGFIELRLGQPAGPEAPAPDAVELGTVSAP